MSLLADLTPYVLLAIAGLVFFLSRKAPMPNTNPTTDQITHLPALGGGVQNLKTFLDAGGSGGSDPLIVVLGDSLVASNALIGDSVVAVLSSKLNTMGVRCRVGSVSRDAHTFNRANTVPFINGKTSVQECIALAPQVVIVSLGINDTVNAVDGRSLAQCQADATTLFTNLRAGLPLAHIIYMGEQVYDSANFAPGTTLNKGVIPILFNLPVSGIAANKYSKEILGDATSATTRSRLADWLALDAHVRGIVTVNEKATINYFKIARLGGFAPDGLHLRVGGAVLAAGYILQACYASTAALFDPLISNSYPVWESPDALFSNAFTASGTDWVQTNTRESFSQGAMTYDDRVLNSWYLSRDVKVTYSDTVVTTASYVFAITGAKPGASVGYSRDGGAFSTIGTVKPDGTLLSSANCQALVDAGALLLGANTVRYSVDDTVFGPFVITVVAGTPVSIPPITWYSPFLENSWVRWNALVSPLGYGVGPNNWVTLRGVAAAGTSGTTVFTLASGHRPAFTRYFASVGAGVLAVISVEPDGRVILTGNTAGISLDGVYFQAF